MRLEGLHHVTAITADAPRNLDFYARLLGLRLIKKTVNFDAPDVYHLYYGDEAGHPGSVLTFFEFPGAHRGRAGAGMVHRIQWRVAGEAALDFWEQRLAGEGVAGERDTDGLRFSDPEGLAHELLVVDVADAPLVAAAPGVPSEHALQGFHGVREFAADAAVDIDLLSALGFARSRDGEWELAGERRRALLGYDSAPERPGVQGAGSVHHVAWAAHDDDELREGRGVAAGRGRQATDVIDRQYFHSVYFRVPSGVLFELATLGPGFAVDEPEDALGEGLMLPPQYESMRSDLERRLTPLTNPRRAAAPR